MTRRTTRVTFDDGSTIAELWIGTANTCPTCGGGLWMNPCGHYHVCIACRRGWEQDGKSHGAADNPALARIITQLASARGA